jgi:hypothetical protein
LATEGRFRAAVCTRDGQGGVGEEDGVLATAQLVMGGVVLEHSTGRVVGDVL